MLEALGGPSISPPGWWRAMSDAIAFSELMAQMEIDPSALGEPADDDVDADLPDGDDGSGLAAVDSDREEDFGGAPSAAASDELVEDDASGAGSRSSEAASGTESEDSFEMSEISSDEFPDEPEPVADAPEPEPNAEEAILTAAAMSRRSRRMFTGGAGAPVSSGLGSVAEPATWEVLMLVDAAAIEIIDASERGEVQLTAGPLDKVDARGFLVADVLGWSEMDAADAAKLGKRVQERAGAAKKEVAAKEKVAYNKTYRLRSAAADDAQLAAGVEEKVAQIEQELAAEVAAIKAKTYDTLLKGIGHRAPREPALPSQPTAAQLRQGMQEMERAKAVWHASVDASSDAFPAVEKEIKKMEEFDERTKGRVLSDKNFNKSFELESRLRCALAVYEAAEKQTTAARATLRAAIALLQRLLDILDERDRAGKVDLGNSEAYGDLWEDARICVSHTENMLALHDKEELCQPQGAGGNTAGAQKRSKRR